MTTEISKSSFQQRVAQACKSEHFTLHECGPCYSLWNVQHVKDGSHARLDGVFFTEEEAHISADLLRGTMCGARAYKVIYAPTWRPDPAREAAIRLEALQCREMLARRLGVKHTTRELENS